MKLVSSILLGVPIGTYGAYYIRTCLGDWGKSVAQACKQPFALSGFPSVDSVLCLFDHIFKHAQHDILGNALNWVFLNVFGVILALMLIEGSRRDFAHTALAWVSVWGMLANLIGISAVFPALWMPFYFFQKSTSPAMVISAERAHGALLSIMVGYIVPTFAMLLLSGFLPNSGYEAKMIALWQFCPIWLGPLSVLFARLFKASPVPSQEKEKQVRLEQIQGWQATERVYLFLGVFNLLVYAATFVHTQLQGLNLKEALLILATKDVPVGLSYAQLGGFLTANLFLVDFVIMDIGVFLWVLLQDGLLYSVALLFGFVLVGPGAAIAFYAAHRERRIQQVHDVTKKDQ